MDVLFEPALIGQRQPGTPLRRGLRDRPRDRPLVGHTNDHALLAREIRHRAVLACSIVSGNLSARGSGRS